MILPSSPIYSKSRELWYDDGNIILEAEDIVFRVYSGILASNSTVFHEMFTFPQPPDEETFEGCPLVHLPDSAVDLLSFLRAIHEASAHSSSFYDIDQIDDFFVLVGVLRLSTKYQVQYLRQRSIKALAALYPSQLSAFEASLPTHSTPSKIRPFRGRVFSAVNLARECNVPIILPSALLRCCTGMNVVELIDGVFSRDGTSHYTLDWQDKRLCLIARSIFETRARKYTMSFLMGTYPDPLNTSCNSRHACDSVRLRFLKSVELTNANYGKVNPFLTGFPWDAFQKDICLSCFRSARQSFEREKHALWQDLPTIFHMGTWDKITNDMKDDLSSEVPFTTGL